MAGSMSRDSSFILRQVHEELVCAICLDILTLPKLLTCAHSFCRACVETLLASSTHQGIIFCPCCRKETFLESNDPDRLPTNFRLISLVGIVSPQIRQRSCQVVRRRVSNRPLSTPIGQSQAPLCSQHQRQVEFFCSDCNELCCSTCLVAKHRAHAFDEAAKVLTTHLTSLSNLIQPVFEAAAKAEELLAKIQEKRGAVTSNKESVSNSVKQCFAKARKSLDERERELLDLVVKRTEGKLEKLGSMEEKLHENLKMANDTVCHIDTLMESTNNFTIFSQSREVTRIITECQQSVQDISNTVTQQQDESILVFDEQQSGLAVNSLCSIREHTPISSSTATTHLPTGPPSSTATTHLPTGPPSSTATTHLPTGPPSSTPGDSVIRQQQPAGVTGTSTFPRIQSKYSSPTNRRSSALYISQMTSSQSCSISFDCSPPPPSIPPLSLSADLSLPYSPPLPQKQPVAEIPTRDGNIDIYPCGIALGVNDSIIVSDVRNNCVRLFASTTSGRLLDTICDGHRPSAVVMDSSGSIYVVESETNQLQRYSNGQLDSRFSHNTRKHASQFGNLRAIAIDKSNEGKIYVTDWSKKCIHVFEHSGRFSCTLSADYLRQPAGIALTNVGNLLVADQESHCVWMMDTSGNKLRQFGSRGSGPGELISPYGVTVARDNSVIVTDSGSHRVSVFIQSGTCKSCFGGNGNEPGFFNKPRHVCMNSRDQVVVADEMNKRIQVFEIFDNDILC